MDHRGVLRDRLGKTVGLVRFLAAEWDAAEADFARYYGLNLGDEVFGDRSNVRRLLVLIAELPEDAATNRTQNRVWTTALELQATTADLIGLVLHAYMSTHAKKHAQIPPPIRIPRPDDLARQSEGVGFAGLARLMLGGGPRDG